MELKRQGKCLLPTSGQVISVLIVPFAELTVHCIHCILGVYVRVCEREERERDCDFWFLGYLNTYRVIPGNPLFFMPGFYNSFTV